MATKETAKSKKRMSPLARDIMTGLKEYAPISAARKRASKYIQSPKFPKMLM